MSSGQSGTVAAEASPIRAIEGSDFIIESRTGFDVNFAITPTAGYTPRDNEARYIARISDCITRLADVSIPGSGAANAEVVAQREHVRDQGVRELRRRANAFVEVPRGDLREARATEEIITTYRIEGRYREWMLRISTIPFVVKAVLRPNKTNLFYDLDISTRDVFIPKERGQFKIKLDSALTVTKIVFGEREKGVSWLWWLVGQYENQVTSVQVRWHEYIIQLNGIASVGLMNMDSSQVEFADQDLERFKSEFATREAGQVKNHYVRRLGFWCVLAAVVFSLLYSVAYYPTSGRILYNFQNFLLLGTGAVVGAWLSFLLRRVVLNFDDLAILEEDRLNPSIRVLFIIGLVTVVGLLFWSGAVVGGIGSFQGATALYSHGAWALLMGLLAGIAERTLGTAVSRRAGDFVAAIGASGGSATAQVR